MKKIIFTLSILILLCPTIFSQRIIFESDFETIPLNSDSLPANWTRFDEDGNNPAIKWAVRDTACNFGGNTRVRAYNSAKSLEIPWYAGSGGNNINDDWVFTDSFTVRQGDSLIFWMLIGSDSTFQPYLDSMQVLKASFPLPNIPATKLATIKSNDSAGIALNNNVWTIHKFNLSSFAGQKVWIAFRYYMNISADGLWCNIDDMFIGNHSAIGIHQIGSNIPKVFNLYQNYPNPFNPTTKFRFQIAKLSDTKITLYDISGKEVTTLVNEKLQPGTYEVQWDGSSYASGVYFYKLTAGYFVQTKKMVVLK